MAATKQTGNMATTIPPDLFKLIAPTLKKTGVDYAIGGAVAMSAAGYTRQTEDVDVFFNHKDTAEVLRALRDAKIRFATLAEPYHYAIIPDVKDPDHRIDLMFTSEDLEMDAVDFPDTAAVSVGRRKVTVNIFPPLLLKTAKVVSDRDKDHDDIRRMHARGLIDPLEIVKTLRGYREPSPSKRLSDILAGRKPDKL